MHHLGINLPSCRRKNRIVSSLSVPFAERDDERKKVRRHRRVRGVRRQLQFPSDMSAKIFSSVMAIEQPAGRSTDRPRFPLLPTPNPLFSRRGTKNFKPCFLCCLPGAIAWRLSSFLPVPPPRMATNQTDRHAARQQLGGGDDQTRPSVRPSLPSASQAQKSETGGEPDCKRAETDVDP